MMRFGDIFSIGLPGMAMALLLGACAGTGPKVVGNYDPATDFSQYRTFAFEQPLGSDNQSGRTAVSTRLIAATIRELQARGLQYVGSNPDLMVNIFVQESSGVRNSPFFHTHGVPQPGVATT